MIDPCEALLGVGGALPNEKLPLIEKFEPLADIEPVGPGREAHVIVAWKLFASALPE